MRNNRGQFMPLAMIVILAVTVFLVGVVNVYRVAKAKIRAQNLADATALYLARNMTQSLNIVADRNEWMNHLYVSSGNSGQGQAGHDPCIRPNPDTTPPGLGCFIQNRGNPPGNYKFGARQSAVAYARLIHTINQIQMLFAQSYDAFTGVSTAGAQSSNAPNVFLANLRRDIPDFQDSNISVVLYNTRNGMQSADKLVQESLNRTPTTGADIKPIIEKAIDYEIGEVDVVYKKLGEDPRVTLSSLLGPGQKAGYMKLKSPKYLHPSKDEFGAGAVVGIRVNGLIAGLGPKTVKARANAYVINLSGNLDPTKDPKRKGSASPTYIVRLGKI